MLLQNRNGLCLVVPEGPENHNIYVVDIHLSQLLIEHPN